MTYSTSHPVPFYEKKLTVFTYAGHPRMRQIETIQSIGDILRLNLTVITYAGNGWNDKHIRKKGIKTYETPLLKSVWKMLANKRGDIVIEWPGGAWPDIHASDLDGQIIQTDVTLKSMPFHLLIGNKSPFIDCLPQFNRVILEMKKTGEIDRIIGKYLILGDRNQPQKEQ